MVGIGRTRWSKGFKGKELQHQKTHQCTFVQLLFLAPQYQNGIGAVDSLFVSSFADSNIVCSHFRFILGSAPLENRSGWCWELRVLTSNLRHFNLRGFCLKPRTQNCLSVQHPCSVYLSFAENEGRLFHCYSNIKQNKPSAGETPRCYAKDLSSIITNARETVVCSHG